MKLALGQDNFQRLRASGAYFVDKSHLIAEFWRDNAVVLLLPRPRRFGKSLNMSMLKYFFSSQHQGRELFQGLAIEQDAELMAEQGQHPVIHINLKDCRRNNFDDFESELGFLTARLLTNLAESFPPEQLLKSADLERWQRLCANEGSTSDLMDSLRLHSQFVHQATGKPAIVLIDEYDAPLLDVHSHSPSDYRQMVSFYRGFLGAALKDNPHLQRGCLTGILRVARESIFSDLNNVIVRSLLDNKFNTSFGFTEAEVTQLLESFDLSIHLNEARQWYNGYNFAGATIYNPWSVLNFIDSQPKSARPYWLGSSENKIIKTLVIEHSSAMREELAQLVDHGYIEAPLDEHIALDDVAKSRDNIWNFLTFTGYLKSVAERWDDFRQQQVHRLCVPNLEVGSFYRKILSVWLAENIKDLSPLKPLLEALQAHNWADLERYLNRILLENISYHDTAAGESFYHALFIGILLHLPGYQLRSNRESGLGRYDCQLTPREPEPSKAGYILEFKQVSSDSNFSKTLTAAQRQIKNLGYAQDLRSAGVQNIHSIAIAVSGKQAKLRAQAA